MDMPDIKGWGQEAMGGETGGAMLDLLKQMSAAGAAGVTAGASKKERQTEQVLKMSQEAFKMRYDTEEPYIVEKGVERKMDQKELFAAMLGMPVAGVQWKERAPKEGEGFIPGIRYDKETGDFYLTSDRVPPGVSGLLLQKPRAAIRNLQLGMQHQRLDNVRWKEAGKMTEKQFMGVIPSPARFTPGTPEYREESKKFDVYISAWHKNYETIKRTRKTGKVETQPLGRKTEISKKEYDALIGLGYSDTELKAKFTVK